MGIGGVRRVGVRVIGIGVVKENRRESKRNRRNESKFKNDGKRGKENRRENNRDRGKESRLENDGKKGKEKGCDNIRNRGKEKRCENYKVTRVGLRMMGGVVRRISSRKTELG